VSIHEGPANGDSKRDYGDWKGDLIVGAKHEGAVLTLIQCKTKHCLMYPLEGKRSDEVMIAVNQL
jgi:IS30 family transposase